ncbi:hypothetical protein HBI23_166340 [Parastagonospora nodorum]|nr:hypothetical protein HBI12_065910 [Parastagonospora nodorum]KAH5651479.1 hypothetical protein HBI23_166340 [Parastagonospora nodorum]
MLTVPVPELKPQDFTIYSHRAFAIHRDFELRPDNTCSRPQILTPRLCLTPPPRLGRLPQAMGDANMLDRHGHSKIVESKVYDPFGGFSRKIPINLSLLEVYAPGFAKLFQYPGVLGIKLNIFASVIDAFVHWLRREWESPTHSAITFS